MFNTLGISGLILFLLIIYFIIMGIYSFAKVPNYDSSFKFAGFWLRLVAVIIDLVIINVAFIIPMFAIGYLIGIAMVGSATESELGVVAGVAGQLLSIMTNWLYHAMMESSKYQATLGKKILGLRVVNLQGEKIDFGQATGRHFGKVLSLLTLSIGHVMMGWTKKKQGLHDKMANCLVVRSIY
jgi:uncharacterized RDD family membrane protein YckC